ncbi:MAG TPA: hypothetical protein VII98_12195 [Solirubrobacteraceae bacterium]
MPRTTLRGTGGDSVATYLAGTREGLPLADDLQPAAGATPELVIATVLRELRGHIVAGGVALGEALVAAGAQPRRRARVMTRDPQAMPPDAPAPAGAAIEQATASDVDALLDAFVAAYPPGHPDHRAGGDRPSEREQLRALMAGEVIGPLLACSRLARDGSGAVVGGALVCDPPGGPPLAGPWLGELFRHPAAPAGTGAALLAAALARARADGLRSIGLAVTDGNPALRIYVDAGFTVAREQFAVLVP